VTDPETLLRTTITSRKMDQYDKNHPEQLLESIYEGSPNIQSQDHLDDEINPSSSSSSSSADSSTSKTSKKDKIFKGNKKFDDEIEKLPKIMSPEDIALVDRMLQLCGEEDMVEQRNEFGPSLKRKSLLHTPKITDVPPITVDEDGNIILAHQDYITHTPTIVSTSDKLSQNRSSTMGGFSGQTSKSLRSFVDGIKMVELHTGKDLRRLYNKKALNDNRKYLGEKLYQTSSSVPDSMVIFARELHQEDRITASEEAQLGKLTQEAIRLLTLYDDLETRLFREPTDEEWCAAAGKINTEAIRQAIDEGLEAKNKLVLANLRMVQGVVNVYIRNGLSGQYNAADMMQEGAMALIRAAEKFEPQRGFRFSTYAMYWIRSAVKRAQTTQSRVITIPQRMHANHRRVQVTERELRRGLGRAPTKKELASAVHMSETQLDRCLNSMGQKCFSLDQEIKNNRKPGSGSSHDTMYDILENRKGDKEGSITQVLLREDLVETLFRVLDRDAAVLVMLRYGLVDSSKLPPGFDGHLTIAQVSQLAGIKPDKIRRKLLGSLQKLKSTMVREWHDFEKSIG